MGQKTKVTRSANAWPTSLAGRASTRGLMPEDTETRVMGLGKRRQFLYGVVAWMLSVIVLLTALESLTLELFFVMSLIGLLVVVELTAPFNVTPRWRRRLLPVIAIGLAGFGYIVIRRILEILPEGVI